MQMNTGVKTIEGTLEAAIVRAGGISADNAGDFFKACTSVSACPANSTDWMPSTRYTLDRCSNKQLFICPPGLNILLVQVTWMRAARTDKGVSAVGQVVSLKLVLSHPDIVERINAELPPEIRVLGFKRVIGSFDARYSCDRRR